MRLNQGSVPAVTPSDSLSAAQRVWPGARRQWLVLLSLGIGSVMGTMNNTIVNTSLPVIREAFGADLSSIEWVMMSYLLAISVLLPIFGRAGDIWGHKRVYLVGLGVFVVASTLCSLSPTEGFLIGSRALQAIGGAALVSNSSAIVSRTFAPERRGQLLGLLYTIASLGTLAGPSLGGFLASGFGWRSIFYANVLLGVLAAAVSLRILPNPPPSQTREPFDLMGAVSMTIGLGAFLLAISKGQDMGWTSVFVVACVLTSAVFLAVFMRVELRLPHPMLDMSLFRIRVFSLAMASAFVTYLCTYSGLFLAPFYLVQGRGFSPGLAGALYSAQPLGMLVTTPLGGYLSDRIGSRVLSTLGALTIGVGLFSLHNLGAESGDVQILLTMALLGLGNGLFIGPNANAVMGSAPLERQGVASGIIATARNLGMVFGVALGGAILALQMAQRAMTQTDTQTIFIAAFQDTFLVMTFIVLIGAAMSLASGPARKNAAPR
ncbi:MAG: MFS transporter [Dehalococcoidia bacterium]|nr:MFS transporter [Dehalococcoidia bacterium]